MPSSHKEGYNPKLNRRNTGASESPPSPARSPVYTRNVGGRTRTLSDGEKGLVRDMAKSILPGEVGNYSQGSIDAPPGGAGKAAFPVYKKDSNQAAGFRNAFASARKAGKKEFEWEGRKYNTKTK